MQIIFDKVPPRLPQRNRVSLFVNPEAKMVEGAKMVGADRIELYTGPYAHGFGENAEKAI